MQTAKGALVLGLAFGLAGCAAHGAPSTEVAFNDADQCIESRARQAAMPLLMNDPHSGAVRLDPGLFRQVVSACTSEYGMPVFYRDQETIVVPRFH